MAPVAGFIFVRLHDRRDAWGNFYFAICNRVSVMCRILLCFFFVQNGGRSALSYRHTAVRDTLSQQQFPPSTMHCQPVFFVYPCCCWSTVNSTDETTVKVQVSTPTPIPTSSLLDGPISIPPLFLSFFFLRFLPAAASIAFRATRTTLERRCFGAGHGWQRSRRLRHGEREQQGRAMKACKLLSVDRPRSDIAWHGMAFPPGGRFRLQCLARG